MLNIKHINQKKWNLRFALFNVKFPFIYLLYCLNKYKYMKLRNLSP